MWQRVLNELTHQLLHTCERKGRSILPVVIFRRSLEGRVSYLMCIAQPTHSAEQSPLSPWRRDEWLRPKPHTPIAVINSTTAGVA